MAELLADTLISPEYAGDQNSDSNKRKPKEVTDIMNWVQCFGVFMAIISLQEPHRIPDLIGYQSLIIQSSLQCLAWNESPSPECLCPSCNFDHICYRCVHTNFADKKHKQFFAHIRKNAFATPEASRGLTPVVNDCM